MNTATIDTPTPVRKGANLQPSLLDPAHAALRYRQPAGEPTILTINAGQTIRIIDLEGNQAADVLFYNRHQSGEHYSFSQTIVEQGGLYLSCGSALLSNEGRVMLTIIADTVGWHDTIGGHCGAESNGVRYGQDKKYLHSCRDNFLLAMAKADIGLTKRDIKPNLNFFMNVPISEEGEMVFADGVSGAGKYVELKAEMDLWMLLSNCPQMNNPCNDYNPTPLEIIVWDPIHE